MNLRRWHKHDWSGWGDPRPRYADDDIQLSVCNGCGALRSRVVKHTYAPGRYDASVREHPSWVSWDRHNGT